ncbi:MAG: hypothetical protein JJU45_11210 [Acidimicrobiia bacterium]|nr:hypothetical protein [Acidimicrobiia bacterium]
MDAQNLAWALATADAHHYSEASQDLAYIGDELASRMDDRLMIGSTAGAGTGVEVAVGYDGTEPAQLGAYFGFGDPVRFHRVEVRLDEVVVHDDVYRLDGSVWSEYERMDEGPFLGPYGLEDVSITGGVSALTAEFRYVDDGIEILCIERGHYPRGAASKFGYAPDWVEVSTCEAR